MGMCRFIEECAFYRNELTKKPEGTGFLKNLYCHKIPQKCQRLKRADEFLLSAPTNEITPLGLDTAKRTTDMSAN
jgi:hypothetical protein